LLILLWNQWFLYIFAFENKPESINCFAMELDKISWSIIRSLQENARASYADIGREVGLSAPAVAERMQKLEEAGIINGYHINLDYEKTGYALKAFITFTAHSGKLLPFLKYIEPMDEVLECHRVTGNYCIFLKVVVKDSLQLEQLLTRFMEYGDTTTSIILSSPITQRVMSKPKPEPTRINRLAKVRLG
jgi:Lrp/AsnC family leucine-responsive transcriptional regulator